VKYDTMTEPQHYPYFTMFGQILGTQILTAECLLNYCPDYFIDTIGLPFSFWLVKLLSSATKIGAYIHYPFIRYSILNQR
jgi:alpha-1,2-mannosyltransferase